MDFCSVAPQKSWMWLPVYPIGPDGAVRCQVECRASLKTQIGLLNWWTSWEMKDGNSKPSVFIFDSTIQFGSSNNSSLSDFRTPIAQHPRARGIHVRSGRYQPPSDFAKPDTPCSLAELDQSSTQSKKQSYHRLAFHSTEAESVYLALRFCRVIGDILETPFMISPLARLNNYS